MSFRRLFLPSILLFAAYIFCADSQCFRFRGRFRDCTCGVRYSDQEERCCNSQTCLQPRLSSQNLSCPFVCQNGGVFDDTIRACTCRRGFYGLCCELETPLCGGVHFAPVGNLSSPNFPQSYPNSIRCLWRISTDPFRRLALGVTGDHFEVEEGTSPGSCNHDWLAVYDGDTMSAKLIGRFCGGSMPTVLSSGRHMMVEFISDWQQRRRGFQLSYVSYFTVEPCGRTTYSRQSGIITSPHYPLPYPAELQCHYTIQVRTGHYVVLSIEELDLPTEDSQCQHGDRIIVKRTLEGQPSEALFVMCGSQRFRPIFISDSTLQQVTLKFSSDCNSSKRKSEGTFKLRFEQIPAFD